MKNNKFIILMSLTVIMLLTVLGFVMKQSSITNFYYYKDKPLNIDLRTDKIFIKTKNWFLITDYTSLYFQLLLLRILII